jgi:hypothetical protein
MPPRALLITLLAITICSLASNASAQVGAHAPDSPMAATRVGDAHTIHAPSTRFAFVDGEEMAKAGIALEGDPVVEADLDAFERGLNVKLFEVSRLLGSIFTTDDRLDLTDDFISAFKGKPSRASRIGLPAREIPDATVAFINTDTFADPLKGVTRLVNVAKTVEREFAPRRAEMLKLRERLGSASGDEKRRLEAEIEKKAAAGQSAIERRWKELSVPVFEEIQAALKTFCVRQGISLLFDLRTLKPGDKLEPYGLPLPADAPDITAAFISAFNKGTH